MSKRPRGKPQSESIPPEHRIIGTNTSLVAMLEEKKKAIQEMLPKHITPERVFKSIGIAVQRQPKLLQCSRVSFLLAVMAASELGLDCSGRLGEGYLVPFGGEVVFIVGYRGLMKLARQGNMARISARLVYENEYREGKFKMLSDPEKGDLLFHEPIPIEKERGPLIGAYMRAELKDGGTQWEYMTVEEINLVARRSKAYSNGPWQTDPGEMSRKTVSKRGMKYLDLNPLLEKAIEYDGDTIELRPSDFDVEPGKESKPGGTRTEQVLAKVKGEEGAPVESTPVTEEPAEVTPAPPEPTTPPPEAAQQPPPTKPQTAGEKVGQAIREGGPATGEGLFDQDESLELDQEAVEREAGK